MQYLSLDEATFNNWTATTVTPMGPGLASTLVEGRMQLLTYVDDEQRTPALLVS